MTLRPRDDRKRIGIIAGSGPEAGADLWLKVIEESKALLGASYSGDLDAPHVRVVSSPVLGLSMELATNEAQVRPEILGIYDELSQNCDYIAIACNTLNIYHSAIKSLPGPARLVSILDVVQHHLRSTDCQSAALLGAAPVTQMDQWSVYQSLTPEFGIEIPANTAELQDIIYQVKRSGGSDPDLIKRFTALVDKLENETVLLACTELPLIPVAASGKTLVDVTRLLAKQLVHNAYCEYF